MFGIENGPRQLLLDSQKTADQGGKRELWASAFADLEVNANEINGYIQRIGLGEKFGFDAHTGKFIQVNDPAAVAYTHEQLIEAWQTRQMKQILAWFKSR